MQLNDDATSKRNQSIFDLVAREYSPSLSTGRTDSTSSLLKPLLISDEGAVLSDQVDAHITVKQNSSLEKAPKAGDGLVLFPKVVASPRHQCDEQLVWSGHSISKIVHDRAISHENLCFLTNMGDDVFLVESDCESCGYSTEDLDFAGLDGVSVSGVDNHGNPPPLVDHFREMRFFT
jgi:hypothetical protein